MLQCWKLRGVYGLDDDEKDIVQQSLKNAALVGRMILVANKVWKSGR